MGWDDIKGRGAQLAEGLFTSAWSVGELAYIMRRPQDLLHDAYRDRVLERVATHGLYEHYPQEVQTVRLGRSGEIRLTNPFVRVGRGGSDDVVAQMRTAARPRSRSLLVVGHCYGVPYPSWMESYFGLREFPAWDVVYNKTNNHYPGSYATWPGFGLISPQLSRVIENIQSAIVGLRTLVRSLTHTFEYDQVALLGYSIGGHLALHAAHCQQLDKLVLYCPVTSLRATVERLGLMGALHGPMERTMRRLRDSFDLADLDLLDPLRHELLVEPDNVLVVVQERDAMVDPRQIDALVARYPAIRTARFGGTHVYQGERDRALRTIKGFLAE